MGSSLSQYTNPRGIAPLPTESPSFDPLFGFPEGRKERVMIATEPEMISAHVETKYRDYCTHLLIDYRTCKRNNFPLVYRCAPEKHHFLQCQYEDYVIRMKEFERERRLRIREARIAGEVM